MSEVVKVKRPVSVWLSQVLLILVLVFLFSFVLPDSIELGRPSFSPIDSSSLAWEMVGISIVLSCLAGLVGLTLRFKTSRFLVTAIFIGVLVWIFYNLSTDPKVRDILDRRPISYPLGFILVILTVSTPFFFLSLALMFSRKVKIFFDPSLIPQVDESAAIFDEPPPPPVFYE